MDHLIPQLLSFVSHAVVVLLAVPIGVFCLECVLAVLPERKRICTTQRHRGRTVVLIPAHNEETGIVSTLQSVQSAMTQSDEIVVVADNCTDRTAEIARSYGACVWERFDAERHGKGYAINFGLDRLREAPPDVVVVLDADCRISQDAIDVLSRCVEQTQRPAQAHNLCDVANSASGDSSLAALGHRFCCLVRPTGAARIGMPCSLMGTGMAFPWSLVDRIRFSGDDLAEDKLLGIDMTLAGHAPQFCPQATVRSSIPADRTAFMSQRRRWEHGHLRLALTQIPRLIWGGVRQGRFSPLWMALDISVPPLALLVLTLMAAFTLAISGWLLGETSAPLLVLLVEVTLLSAAVAAGWCRFCRHDLPLSLFGGLPGYLIRKLPLYASFFLGRGQRAWVRTAREATHESTLPS